MSPSIAVMPYSAADVRAWIVQREHANVRRVHAHHHLTRLSILTLASLLAAGCSVGGAAPTPTSTVPPGGVSIDLAVARAEERVSADSVLVEARAGRFGDVYTDSQGVHHKGPVPDEQMVWVVKFAAMFEICPPDGSACWSPRPGWTTVILDFYSGEVLSIEGEAPKPR
jgi:hypothetical protein